MIYLKFNNHGQQTDVKMAAKKPQGWHKAPNDFTWEKRYKLDGKKLIELDPKLIAKSQLRYAKQIASDDVKTLLDKYRAVSCAYSPLKAAAYEAQYKAAKALLDNNIDSLTIRTLAAVRGVTPHEMAELIIQKNTQANEKLITLEAFEDQADQLIEASESIEALDTSLSSWKEKLEKHYD